MSPILIVYRDAGALESLFADITVQWTLDSSVELFCNFYNLQWPMGLHFNNNVSGSCVTETSFFVAKLKVLSADKLI